MPAAARRLILARAGLVLALAAEAAVLLYGLTHEFAARILWTESISLVLFGGAVAALAASRLPARAALIGVVVAGFGLQLIGLADGPSSSDDVYRYAWDAKVQLAGIDPYRYAPNDPALDPVRSDTLFPRNATHCAWQLKDKRCSLVNRPSVHTVYPPVAEAAFALTRVLSFGRTDGPRPFQVLGLFGGTAISALLAWWALRSRREPWTVALWAWCPITVLEVVNNAHIDWLAVLLSLLALTAVRAGRINWAGGLLGAAVATKIYPGLLVFSMLRRQPRRVVAFAAGLVVLSYVPHVLAVGAKVIGFLPGYLREENYTSGGRFMLLDVVLPKALLNPVAGLILAAIAVWALRRTRPDFPQGTAVVVAGVTLMVTTPSYAWYALLLLGLVALSGQVAWLPMVIATTISMLGGAELHHGFGFRTGTFAVGAALTGGLLLVQRRRGATRTAARAVAL